VDALTALAELVAEGLDVRLACIGFCSAEDLERLQAVSRSLGLGDRVSFTGQVRDRASIYAIVDAVAVTSRWEAFGRVPFEATDAGLPVVYPRSGGCMEYMLENQTGLAYTPGNSHELARNLKDLATDPELGVGLVRAARLHMHHLRSDPCRVPRLVDQLRSAHAGSPAGTTGDLPSWLWRMAIEVVAERDAVVTERDAVVAERDAVVGARIWRYSAPYRAPRSAPSGWYRRLLGVPKR
jgi:hypothetical protein